jgi:hypothetical protein
LPGCISESGIIFNDVPQRRRGRLFFFEQSRKMDFCIAETDFHFDKIGKADCHIAACGPSYHVE